LIPDDVLADAVQALKSAGIHGGRREAQLLWDAAPNAADFEALLTRRVNREPVSHLIGKRDFYNHAFHVSSDVLDPRPDTETLVSIALQQPAHRILDLGTGSGCILLSLLDEMAKATGLGADLSAGALSVAKKNMAKLELESRCHFVQSDWFENVTGTFDLIVSNPPYIAVDEMETLQPEVRLFEPRIALTDEGDGLSAYRSICAGVDPYLTSGGRLLVEIGPTQAAAVSDMMVQVGLIEIVIHQDIDRRDRVVECRKPG